MKPESIRPKDPSSDKVRILGEQSLSPRGARRGRILEDFDQGERSGAPAGDKEGRRGWAAYFGSAPTPLPLWAFAFFLTLSAFTDRPKGPINKTTHIMLVEEPLRAVGVDAEGRPVASVKPPSAAVWISDPARVKALVKTRPDLRLGYGAHSGEEDRWQIWFFGPGRLKAEVSLAIEPSKPEARALLAAIKPEIEHLSKRPDQTVVDVEILGVDPDQAISAFAAKGQKLVQLAWHQENFGQPYVELAFTEVVYGGKGAWGPPPLAEDRLQKRFLAFRDSMPKRWPVDRVDFTSGSSSALESSKTAVFFFAYGTDLSGFLGHLYKARGRLMGMRNGTEPYRLQMVVPSKELSTVAERLRKTHGFVQDVLPRPPRAERY